MTVAFHVRQTLANLKNAQATLEIYAMESQEEESRTVFREAVETTAIMLSQLEEHLITLANTGGTEPLPDTETVTRI